MTQVRPFHRLAPKFPETFEKRIAIIECLLKHPMFLWPEDDFPNFWACADIWVQDEEIHIECGPPGCHDVMLDYIGPSFDLGLVDIGQRVQFFYGSEGTSREDLNLCPIPSTWEWPCTSLLDGYCQKCGYLERFGRWSNRVMKCESQ